MQLEVVSSFQGCHSMTAVFCFVFFLEVGLIWFCFISCLNWVHARLECVKPFFLCFQFICRWHSEPSKDTAVVARNTPENRQLPDGWRAAGQGGYRDFTGHSIHLASSCTMPRLSDSHHSWKAPKWSLRANSILSPYSCLLASTNRSMGAHKPQEPDVTKRCTRPKAIDCQRALARVLFHLPLEQWHSTALGSAVPPQDLEGSLKVTWQNMLYFFLTFAWNSKGRKCCGPLGSTDKSRLGPFSPTGSELFQWPSFIFSSTCFLPDTVLIRGCPHGLRRGHRL